MYVRTATYGILRGYIRTKKHKRLKTHKRLKILSTKQLSSEQRLLCEIIPHLASIFGTHNALVYGLGGGFWLEDCTPHLWQKPLPAAIQQLLITANNPHDILTINNLELPAHILQVHLTALMCPPLTHLSNGNNNVASLSQAHCISVSIDGPAAALLWWRTMLLQHHHLVTSTFSLSN
eukprot:12227077-Ditylum_brightwellii.AAC.1